LETTLVELNTDLVEEGQTRFDHYTQTADENSHGITGVQPLADKSIVFTTDQGYLYRVTPLEYLPSRVEPLGWFHPQGKSYVASLFTSDGRSYVMGLSLGTTGAGPPEWLVFDLSERASRAIPISLPAFGGQPIGSALLYGSITRDNDGACYLGGVFHRGIDIPLLLRVSGPTFD
jgi:hypothetical protein